MNARLLVILSVHTLLLDYWVQRSVHCVSVNLFTETPSIISKSKVELTPILITSGLNDIVVLSAPIVSADASYYLHRPNGDAIRLNFKGNRTDTKTSSIYNDLKAKYIAQDNNPSSGVFHSKVFNVNNNESCCNSTDVFAQEERKMAAREFMIGPLLEADHGNWVLSAYYKDIDGNWVEFFQVITIEIIEKVPLSPQNSILRVGDTFALGFAYPIPDLQGCQLEPPATTCDRYYDRNRTNLNMCEFIMKNVTLEDEGVWSVTGVGRIVHRGTAVLKVKEY